MGAQAFLSNARHLDLPLVSYSTAMLRGSDVDSESSFTSAGSSSRDRWARRHNEIVSTWHAQRAEREVRRARAAEARESEELRECSFKPKLVAKGPRRVAEEEAVNEDSGEASGVDHVHATLLDALTDAHDCHDRKDQANHHHAWEFLRSYEGRKAAKERTAAC